VKLAEPTLATTPSTVITLACNMLTWYDHRRTPASSKPSYWAWPASCTYRLSMWGPGMSTSTSTPRWAVAASAAHVASSGTK
jgi:hypothetical protein